MFESLDPGATTTDSGVSIAYALYARTSTERQREQETIESQLAALRDDSRRKVRHVVAEFIDDGVSGSFLNRPGLNALREGARTGQFKAVLFWDFDRLGRADIIEMLALRKELMNLGIPLIEGCAAWLECRLVQVHPAGDHDICMGEVTAAIPGAGDPLILWDRAFWTLR